MEKLFGIPMDWLATRMLFVVGLILVALLALSWRNRVMLRLALRNVPRRRAQTVLIVFGLMLSTLIISAAFGTGDTMTYSFRTWVLDELGELDETVQIGGEQFFFGRVESAQEPSFFDYHYYESLRDEIGRRQAQGDRRANLVEALTPIIQLDAPVVNQTARQSEPRLTVAGYQAQSAQNFAELTGLGGERVTIAELEPDQVYLNDAMAEELVAEPGHRLTVYLDNEPVTVTVRSVVERGALPGQLFMRLERVQATLDKPEQITAILVSNQGGPYSGAQHSSEVSALLRELIDDLGHESLRVQRPKKTSLDGVEFVGSIFTTVFIGFGSFSIAAGLLLIFLIFVMLAAERKKEMGMARAIGTRRRHLIQMFVFEGTVYDLAAAAVGALLGVLVGLATVEIMASGLESASPVGGFKLRYHIELRSLVVAYCLGMLLTFITVTVSSWRVSVLNIVAAIRDLPPPPDPDAGLCELFARPWRHLFDVPRKFLRLRLHIALKRVFWDGPVSTLAFFWALLIRGPFLVMLGILSILLSLAVESAFFFHMGISFVLIGIGFMLRWVLGWSRLRPETRDRIGFSWAGVGLLIYWSLPLDALDFMDLPNFKTGPEMFVLSGIMMVAGAVWTIIYNSDVLLGLVTRLLSPFSSLLPVVRTAIAYPMSNKFRTGLTLAMFALIVFTLVFMSIFVYIFNQTFEAENIEELTEGYDIQAEVSQVNPIPDLAAAIDQAQGPKLDPADVESVSGFATRYVEVRQKESGRDWANYTLRIVDRGYLESTAPNFVLLAEGYDSPEAVWQALRETPGLAVVDSFVVPSRRTPGFVVGGPRFRLRGVYQEDERMPPIPVSVREPETGREFEVTIVGVVETGPLFYAGLFISQPTLVAATGQSAPPSRYFVKLADGVDAPETAQALESIFLQHGLEAEPIAEQIQAQRGMSDSMVGLIQAFMGLGLVVGIAALGVISSRAVVERRHQIGMLRAVGYRRWMIQWSFLLESSFVALVGIFIGLALGLILAYNFYNSEVTQAGPSIELSFAIPWVRLTSIVLIAYGASLLTTFLPAWQAARIYPAEALRYE